MLPVSGETRVIGSGRIFFIRKPSYKCLRHRTAREWIKRKTILLKKGVDRGALIYMEGTDDMKVQDTLQVLSKYVPVNARTLEVASGTSLRKGDRILVDHPSGKEWIASLGCDIFGGGISALGWKEGDMDLTWDRTVTRSKR